MLPAKPSLAQGAAARAATFAWDDPLLLEDQLSEEERMVRDSARAYCQEKLMPRVLEAHRHEQLRPRDLQRDGRAGLPGLDHRGLRLRGREPRLLRPHRARGRARRFRLPLGMSVQSSLVMHPIHAYGTEEQRKKYLPRLASGELVGCFGLTEPGPRLRSRRHDDARAQGAAAAIGSTAPRCGSPTRRSPTSSWSGPRTTRATIRGFVLEKGMKGLSAPKIEGKFSLRASVTGEIVMDDVFVPEENLLPNVKGLEGSLRLPQQRALRHRAGARWARPNSAGTPRASTPSTASSSAGRSPPTSSIQKKLADMQTEIALGLQAALRVGRLHGRGPRQRRR